MHIQVNANQHIQGGDSLRVHVETTLQDALAHFRDEITRVEVHLSDENSHKGGDDDLRCTIEVRIRGLQPLAVTHHNENVHAAFEGAIDRITRSVRKTVEKRRQS